MTKPSLPSLLALSLCAALAACTGTVSTGAGNAAADASKPASATAGATTTAANGMRVTEVASGLVHPWAVALAGLRADAGAG